MEWLGLDPKLAENGVESLQNPLTTLLEAMGLGWDQIMGSIADAFPQDAIASMLAAFESMGEVLQNPGESFAKLGEWIDGAIAAAGGKIEELASGIEELWNGIIDKVKSGFTGALWPSFLKSLGKYLLPGVGLFKLLWSIFTFGLWLWNNWDRLKEKLTKLWNEAKDSFKVAVETKDSTQVGKRIENMLGISIGPVLEGLAVALGIDGFLGQIQDLVTGAAGLALKPIKAVVKASTKGRLPGKPSKGATPLLPPIVFGPKERQRKLWIDEKGQVWLSASEPRTWEEALKTASSQAKQQLAQPSQKVATDYKGLATEIKTRPPVAPRPKNRKGKKRGKGQPAPGAKQAKEKQGKVKKATSNLKSDLKKLAELAEKLGLGACPAPTKGSCFVKGTLVDIGNGQKPLGPGWIAGTCRVLTHTANEGGSLHPEQGPPKDHEDRRLIYLVVRAGQPDEVFLTLLRPLQWLKDYRVSEGAIIPLDLPEMAVEGDAFVLKVAPCPTVVEGEGSLVTGTFAHKNGEVLELKVASEREPLGVTASHWFWSIDRQQWVPAGMLQKGEKLLAKERVTTVEAMEEMEEGVPVYNLEVEGDHVYRVGQSGILVHNTSEWPTEKATEILNELQNAFENDASTKAKRLLGEDYGTEALLFEFGKLVGKELKPSDVRTFGANAPFVLDVIYPDPIAKPTSGTYYIGEAKGGNSYLTTRTSTKDPKYRGQTLTQGTFAYLDDTVYAMRTSSRAKDRAIRNQVGTALADAVEDQRWVYIVVHADYDKEQFVCNIIEPRVLITLRPNA